MHIRHLIAMLMALVVVAFAWTSAQSVIVEKITPTIIAGDNVGFRVEGLRGGTPVGRIVVMIKGRWIEAELAGGATPLSTR